MSGTNGGPFSLNLACHVRVMTAPASERTLNKDILKCVNIYRRCCLHSRNDSLRDQDSNPNHRYLKLYNMTQLVTTTFCFVIDVIIF